MFIEENENNVTQQSSSPNLFQVTGYSFIALITGFFIEVAFRALNRNILLDYTTIQRQLILLFAQLLVAILIGVYLFEFFAKGSSRAETILFGALFFLPQSLFAERFQQLVNLFQEKILFVVAPNNKEKDKQLLKNK